MEIAQGKIHFKSMKIGLQATGGEGNAKSLIAIVHLDLEVGDALYRKLVVSVKQPLGSRYKDFPLEIGRPHGYPGQYDYQSFRDEVEKYYREIYSQNMRVDNKNAPGIVLRDGTISQAKTVSFTFEKDSPWW